MVQQTEPSDHDVIEHQRDPEDGPELSALDQQAHPGLRRNARIREQVRRREGSRLAHLQADDLHALREAQVRIRFGCRLLGHRDPSNGLRQGAQALEDRGRRVKHPAALVHDELRQETGIADSKEPPGHIRERFRHVERPSRRFVHTRPFRNLLGLHCIPAAIVPDRDDQPILAPEPTAGESTYPPRWGRNSGLWSMWGPRPGGGGERLGGGNRRPGRCPGARLPRSTDPLDCRGSDGSGVAPGYPGPPPSRMLKNPQAAQKGPAARRRPKAAGEAYFLYVEPAAEGANEADGPFSAACARSRRRRGAWAAWPPTSPQCP